MEMMFDDDDPKPTSDITIGADLSFISIEELEKRIVLLTAEIERIKADIAMKQSSRQTADNFFKSPE